MALTDAEQKELLEKVRTVESTLTSNRDDSSPKGASIRNLVLSLHKKVNILLDKK